MNARGFALLTVLWVLTALATLTGAGMVVARLGSDTTRNRTLLARAEWAREACGEILLARFARDPATRHVDTIDLGRGTWCRVSVDDPSARLNLNTADRDALVKLIKAIALPPAVAESVIALQTRGAIHDVRQIAGFDPAETTRLAAFVTTRGTGVINANAAPAQVLALVPGITEEGMAVLLARRTTRPIRGVDEFGGVLSSSARRRLLENYAEFVRAVVFDAPQLIVTLEGGVQGTSIVAHATLTTVPVPGRLAVIRRETE